MGHAEWTLCQVKGEWSVVSWQQGLKVFNLVTVLQQEYQQWLSHLQGIERGLISALQVGTQRLKGLSRREMKKKSTNEREN